MGCGGGNDDEIDITQGGLVKKRGCTDCLCVIGFFGFLFFWLGLAALAFQKGDPNKLIYPADSYGNLCGQGDYVDKPYVLYFDIAECMSGGVTSMMLNGGRCPSHQKCVDKCPTEFWLYQVDAEWQFDITGMNLLGYPFLKDLHCTPQADATIKQIMDGSFGGDAKAQVGKLMDEGECSSKQMPSNPVQNRCFPGTPAELTTEQVLAAQKTCESNLPTADAAARSSFHPRNGDAHDADCTMANVTVESAGMKEILADLEQTWKLILFMLSIAIIVSLIWILFLRFLGGKLVWIFVIGSNCLFGGLAVYGYFEWERLKETGGVDLDLFTVVSGSMLHSPTFWLWTMILSGIIFVIIFVITLFMCQRIRMATTIMEEATKAVGAVPWTMAFPITMALMYLLVIYWYTTVAAYTATAATAVYREIERTVDNGDDGKKHWTPYLEIGLMPECNITEYNEKAIANPEEHDTDKMCILDEYVDDYGWTNSTLIVQFYHVFGFYWCMNIVSGMCQVTLAGVFASWYFARRKPKDIPKNALWKGFRSMWWHFGTIVFGAFIIAIVQIMRAVLNYIDKKTKRYQNKFTKAIICCLKCCLWCMEKCLKYISQNAYIITAMYGYGFIRSACKAMKLIIANAARAAAVTGVTNLVLFVGKLLISVGLALWSYYLFDRPDVSTGVKCNLTNGTEAEQSACTLLDRLVDNPDLVKSTEMVVLLIFLGSYMIASGFFKVYSMAIATIFICFLEDLERNDGSAQKPYFMSKSLMKIMGKKNAPETANATEVSKVKQK